MNADPRVMEYFPNTLSPEESDNLAARIEHCLEERGFGLWAVEIPGLASFIGFVGLAQPYWGHDDATEAATAALAHTFGPFALNEVAAFTTVANRRSQPSCPASA